MDTHKFITWIHKWQEQDRIGHRRCNHSLSGFSSQKLLVKISTSWYFCHCRDHLPDIRGHVGMATQAGYESSSPLITLIFESQKVIYYCGYGIYFFRFGLWDWFFVKFQKIRGYDLCVNLLWRRWKGQCDKEWVLINEGQKNLCLGGFLKALCLTWRSCPEVWRWYSKFHRFIFIINCFNSAQPIF